MIDLLASRARRRLLFALLYLTEGAPIGYLWWAVPTRMKAAGWSSADIGVFASAITLPWILKFLWAPAVDALQSARFGLRGWIVAAQLAMAAALVGHVIVDPVTSWQVLLITSLLHACAAATQDVAIDALALRTTDPDDLGSVNGAMQTGMFGGRVLFGAGGLVLGTQLGSQGPPLLLIALLVTTALLVLVAVPPVPPTPASSPRRVTATLAMMARAPRFWLGILIASLAGAGFEAIGVNTGPLLTVRGASEAETGVFFATVTTPCLIAGALLGGVAADRAGSRRATAIAIPAMALIACAFLLVDAPSDTPTTGLRILLGVAAVGTGAVTTASYALFMSRVHPGAPVAVFTAWLAGTNLCEAWCARLGGELIERASYGVAFATLGAISLLALWPLARFDAPPEPRSPRT